MEVELRNLKGNVIHDFPYPRGRRKCPHVALISITHSGSCVHKCPMCYARAYPWSVEDKIIVYKNVPEKLDAEINKAYILPPFYISQVSDALQPVPEVRNITFKVIQILMNYKLSFRVVTKSADGALSLLDALPELVEYPYWGLSMTVEATPEKQEVTSPYASKIEHRFSAIKKLTSLGIPVIGRTDPTILGFVKIEEVKWIIKRLAESGAHHIIGSLGYYNYLSARRLFSAIEKSKWRTCIPEVEKIYGYCRGVEPERSSPPLRKRYMADFSTRVRFHSILRQEAETYGLTYAVCLELPKEYDSPGIPSCEPGQRNFVHRRIEGFPLAFRAIDCSGDCLRSCPDRQNPPCGKIAMQTQYPFRIISNINNQIPFSLC